MDAQGVQTVHELCKARAFGIFEAGDSHEPRADFVKIGQELMDQIEGCLKRLLVVITTKSMFSKETGWFSSCFCSDVAISLYISA